MSSSSRRNPQLVELFEKYLIDKDTATLIEAVSRRYTVPTLERLVLRGRRQARRAAVLILGHLADYESNATLGRALVDRDRGVRTMADASIRKVWCRVGSEAQRQTLKVITRLNNNRQSADAIRKATQLIHQLPWLAEAWHQRGFAYYQIDDFEASLRDFHQTLEINPYHFSAAAAMGQCYLKQQNSVAALQSFRRALRLNPGLENVRAHVIQLQRSIDDV